MAENMVTLKLSNPLTAEQAERARAKDIKDYPTPGMEITVPREVAITLIQTGYAAVDPEDRDAVDKALGGGSSTTATKSSSGSGSAKSS